MDGALKINGGIPKLDVPGLHKALDLPPIKGGVTPPIAIPNPKSPSDDDTSARAQYLKYGTGPGFPKDADLVKDSVKTIKLPDGIQYNLIAGKDGKLYVFTREAVLTTLAETDGKPNPKADSTGHFIMPGKGFAVIPLTDLDPRISNKTDPLKTYKFLSAIVQGNVTHNGKPIPQPTFVVQNGQFRVNPYEKGNNSESKKNWDSLQKNLDRSEQSELGGYIDAVKGKK
jgi:hypothetical protein